MKANPPCPPSNRLLNLVKLGVQQEQTLSSQSQTISQEKSSNDDESTVPLDTVKKINPINDFEMDINGQIEFFSIFLISNNKEVLFQLVWISITSLTRYQQLLMHHNMKHVM